MRLQENKKKECGIF